MTCKHTRIVTYVNVETNQPTSLWACAECGRRFEPLSNTDDTALLSQALEALEHLHRTGDTQVFDLCYAPTLIPALQQRLGEKT